MQFGPLNRLSGDRLGKDLGRWHGAQPHRAFCRQVEEAVLRASSRSSRSATGVAIRCRLRANERRSAWRICGVAHAG